MTTAELIGLLANLGAIAALVLVLRRWRWAPLFGVCVQGVWWAWAACGNGTWPLYIACTGYTLAYLWGTWRAVREPSGKESNGKT